MTETTIFHSSGLYYSDARRCWRIEVYETGGTWQQNHVGFVHAERKADGDRVADAMQEVANFSDFQLLISRLKENMQPTGYLHGVAL